MIHLQSSKVFELYDNLSASTSDSKNDGGNIRRILKEDLV